MPPAVVKGDPIVRACAVLQGRIKWPAAPGHDDVAAILLDGRAVSRPQLVAAANAVLAGRGEALIAYPGVAAPAPGLR